MPKKNYYQILGIEKDAELGQIRSAYLCLSLKWHPDKNPNNQEEAEKMFKEIAEAYEVLSNFEERKKYDAATDFDKVFLVDPIWKVKTELSKWMVGGAREGPLYNSWWRNY